MASPPRDHSATAARWLPHVATPMTTPKATASGPHRTYPLVSAACDTPTTGKTGVDQASASPALTDASSTETPETPKILASWAIGSTLVWLYPSRPHGKPVRT